MGDFCKDWKARNQERVRAYRKAYYEAHREQEHASRRKWGMENPDRIKELRRADAKKNGKARRERRKPTRNANERKRYWSNLEYRLEKVLRASLTQAVRLQGTRKSVATERLVGCSWGALRAHLESLWKPGMTWENYGYGEDRWNIDHIKPCASFDLSSPEQQKACFHYSNLQPMWQPENFKKGSTQL